jgi:hypothetical protein
VGPFFYAPDLPDESCLFGLWLIAGEATVDGWRLQQNMVCKGYMRDFWALLSAICGTGWRFAGVGEQAKQCPARCFSVIVVTLEKRGEQGKHAFLLAFLGFLVSYQRSCAKLKI